MPNTERNQPFNFQYFDTFTPQDSRRRHGIAERTVSREGADVIISDTLKPCVRCQHLLISCRVNNELVCARELTSLILRSENRKNNYIALRNIFGKARILGYVSNVICMFQLISLWGSDIRFDYYHFTKLNPVTG